MLPALPRRTAGAVTANLDAHRSPTRDRDLGRRARRFSDGQDRMQAITHAFEIILRVVSASTPRTRL